ncbi:NnrU family protein [Paracoccus aminophilus]|uniref:NnrU family protein n=1 Tax=Paracoccus aminophilus JCM 7686 TaxID=1367847 RepID=S5XXT0_PARAH|nr:NnrU family protein [Paracoccus aminophilus]AGT10092.1 NnrU family protein [Paracoccus aminophilus JCM 7686]
MLNEITFAWAELLLALAAFLGAHIIPIRFKDQLTDLLGRRFYLLFYSALSLFLLYWLILAAGRAPIVMLWPQASWMRWLVNLVMPLAFLLGATGGFAGVLTGFALWAGAHLIANGDLAHVGLFGFLLAYALVGFWRARPVLRLKLTPLRIGIGLLLWAAMLRAHAALIGVSPLP